MLAVYYVDNAAPHNMYSLKVEDEDHSKFLEELDKQNYPMPTSDVLFIENDEVVNTWSPFP